MEPWLPCCFRCTSHSPTSTATLKEASSNLGHALHLGVKPKYYLFTCQPVTLNSFPLWLWIWVVSQQTTFHHVHPWSSYWTESYLSWPFNLNQAPLPSWHHCPRPEHGHGSLWLHCFPTLPPSLDGLVYLFLSHSFLCDCRSLFTLVYLLCLFPLIHTCVM